MSLIKSTFWYTAGNFLSRAIGFLLLPLYSNLISAEEFGNYSLIMAGYVLISAIYQGGLSSGFTKYYLELKNNTERKLLFSSVFNFILVTSLILSIILSLFSVQISGLLLGQPDRQNLILIAGWMLFTDTLFFMMLHLLKTNELARKAAILTLFSAVLNLVFNLWFVYYLQKGIEGILLAQLLSGIFALFIMVQVIKDNYQFYISNKFLKTILWFSLPLVLAGLLSSLVDVADRFIINHFLDKASVGIYSFSYRIALIMNIFVISFRTAWTPYSLRIFRDDPQYPLHFGITFTKLIFILFAVLLIVSLFIDDVFNMKFISGRPLFNQEYRGGIAIIPFILAGYAFSGIISFYSVYPYISGKSSHFLINDIICFLVNIILNLVLIPVWGLTGAALATSISFAAGALYLLIISHRIKIYYEAGKLSGVAAIGIACIITGIYLQNVFTDLLLIALFCFVCFKLLGIDFKFRFV